MKPQTQNQNTPSTMQEQPTAADRAAFFGGVIYAYTRAQAVADGVQVDVTKTAKEAGISFPVFLSGRITRPAICV